MAVLHLPAGAGQRAPARRIHRIDHCESERHIKGLGVRPCLTIFVRTIGLLFYDQGLFENALNAECVRPLSMYINLLMTAAGDRHQAKSGS